MRPPPLVIDTSTLPGEEARRLAGLLEEAGFFELPDELAPDRAHPDAFGYELSVTEEGGRTKSVGFDYGSAPESLRKLVTAVRGLAR